MNDAPLNHPPEADDFARTIVQAMPLPVVNPRAAQAESTAAAPSDDTLLRELPTLGYIGRYALKHQLGQGGLGSVYAAIDPLLSRPIALKTLRLDADRDQRVAFESMLLAEARAAAGLNHPNIVTVFDAGLDGQGVYIAMERLQGQDLKQKLADGFKPSLLQAAQIVQRMAEALDYAHQAGVVHCDVKPANIFMTESMVPKLVDFGIAKVTQAAGVDIPLQLAPLDALSPYYAAPELFEGASIDARSDVYSLGVVLHELLCGRRPYDGDSVEALKAAVLLGGAAPAHAHNPKVPTSLSQVAARAMARRPAQRFRSALQMAHALQRELDALQGTRSSTLTKQKIVVTGAASVMVLVGATIAWPTLPEAPPQASAARSAAPVADTNAMGALPWRTMTTVMGSTLATNAEVKPRFALTPSAPNAKPALAASAQANGAKTKPALPSGALANGASQGEVMLAVAPWGKVEVNGKVAGLTPPLTSLKLPAGTHRIVVHNADFTPYQTTVTVDGRSPVTVRHRFGS